MNDIIPREKEPLIKQAIEEMQGKIETLIINDEQSMTMAGHILGEIKVRIRRLNDLKAELTKPMADAVKTANNWIKLQKEPFEKMEMSVKASISEYVRAEEVKALEEQKKLEAEQKKAEAEAKKNKTEAPAPLAPIEQPKAQVRTEHGTVHTKKIWTYDITDEKKIPREFLCVDRAKVTQAVRNGERKIAGIVIYQKTSVSI